jgi:hypothetical protein
MAARTLKNLEIDKVKFHANTAVPGIRGVSHLGNMLSS